MSFEMYIPTRILFGEGKLNELGNQKMPGKKAMVITYKKEYTNFNKYLEKVKEELKRANIEIVIFAEIEENPTKDSIMEGAKFAKENNCDFVVALGGGSVMDASKVIAFMAKNDGDVWDYINGGTGKNQPMKEKPLPVIAITTTAGTGSEVDQWGVVNNTTTKEKIGFGGYDELFPVISIVDPELTKSVSPEYTAYQGFDALFHSVECYISKTANLMSDMYAEKAIENIGKYLTRTVAYGDDIEAREHLSFANNLSGTVMTISSCTSEHSMEHAMSAYHSNLPHGAGLIMISKAYFTYFIKAHVCDERFIKIAKLLGKEESKNPMDFIEMLDKLQKECNVADLKMSDYGITEDEFEKMAQNAKDTMGGLFMADRRELTIEDCVNIYKESYK